GPAGSGLDDPGSSAATPETRSSHHRDGAQAAARSTAPPSHAGPMAAARVPSTVTTGTTGATAMFAGNAHGPASSPVSISTGSVARCATTHTASTSATGPGIHGRLIRSAVARAASTSAAVADTDRTNPAPVAVPGSSTATSSTPADSAARGRQLRRAPSAASPIAPVPAARSTAGSGPTTATNPTSASPAATIRPRRPAPAAAAAISTAPTT